MSYILLICFLVSLSSGLLISFVLIYLDARLLWRDRYKYFWETVVNVFFSICQSGSSIAGIVAISITLSGETEPYWLDAVILCNLQLSAATNVSILVHSKLKKLIKCLVCTQSLCDRSSSPVYMDFVWYDYIGCT